MGAFDEEGMKSNNNHRRRKGWVLWGAVGVVVLGALLGLSAALRPNRQIDPSKLATAERGDIARSVVATGKIEPLAKVEIKSKASGIVKRSEEHTSELQSLAYLVCRLLLEK